MSVTHRRHYKDVFQDAYDEAVENGASEDEAGQIGLDAITDRWAAMADDYRDRMKERGQ